MTDFKVGDKIKLKFLEEGAEFEIILINLLVIIIRNIENNLMSFCFPLSSANEYIEKIETEGKGYPKLKLEVGKKYEDLTGDITVIVADLRKFGIDIDCPFLGMQLGEPIDIDPYHYSENGRFSDYTATEHHLIKEHQEPKEYYKNSVVGYVPCDDQSPSNNDLIDILSNRSKDHKIYQTKEEIKNLWRRYDGQYIYGRLTFEELPEPDEESK